MRTPDPPDLEKMLKPGTDEYQAFHHYLSVSADYLAELDKARVPVLWAPFHEIDGGWFWWADAAKPENAAALWRQMFRYLVNERKLHNLIWVYHRPPLPPAVGRRIAGPGNLVTWTSEDRAPTRCQGAECH